MAENTDLMKEMFQMPLNVIGPKFVTFTGNSSPSDDDKRRENVGAAAAATGAAGAGYSATRGAAFKMFKSSEKLRGTINTVAEGATLVSKPIKQSNSLWNALKVNYRQLRLDIANWAKASKMPNFMKAMFTGKLGAIIGGGASIFVFLTGITEVVDTFANNVKPMMNK